MQTWGTKFIVSLSRHHACVHFERHTAAFATRQISCGASCGSNEINYPRISILRRGLETTRNAYNQAGHFLTNLRESNLEHVKYLTFQWTNIEIMAKMALAVPYAKSATWQANAICNLPVSKIVLAQTKRRRGRFWMALFWCPTLPSASFVDCWQQKCAVVLHRPAVFPIASHSIHNTDARWFVLIAMLSPFQSSKSNGFTSHKSKDLGK